METVYILGQMRGIKWFNFPAFDAESIRIRASGNRPISPADIDRDNGFDAMTLPSDYDWNTIPDYLDIKEIIRRDIEAIQGCTAYVCLDGWEKSTGARAEKALCDWLGLKDMTEKRATNTLNESVCQEGHRLTTSDRNSSYGHPLDNFGITIDMINARFRKKLKEPFSAEDFAEIQIICKLGRQANASKRDNLVDIAGYANTHQMVVEERERRITHEFD